MRSITAGDDTSMRWNEKRRSGCDRAFARFPSDPFERSSTASTCQPSASSRSTSVEPMKPAPPVTIAFIVEDAHSALGRGNRPARDASARRHRRLGADDRHASSTTIGQTTVSRPIGRIATVCRGETHRRATPRPRGPRHAPRPNRGPAPRCARAPGLDEAPGRKRVGDSTVAPVRSSRRPGSRCPRRARARRASADDRHGRTKRRRGLSGFSGVQMSSRAGDIRTGAGFFNRQPCGRSPSARPRQR